MKYLLLAGSLLLLLFISAAFICNNKTEKQTLKLVSPVNNTDDKGFAVMELFTSQGCSSCPSADALLSKYADAGNDNIIPLSFHVDYWNRLGWKDVYSEKAFTERQYRYANIIPGASVYTPQLVINGETEMVGSEAGRVSSSVTSALRKAAAVHVSVSEIKRNGNSLTVSYMLDKAPAGTVINIGLVQEKTMTNIRSGENRGLKLYNSNVIRDFKTGNAALNGTTELSLPSDATGERFFIAAYVQENASGKILGGIKKSIQ